MGNTKAIIFSLSDQFFYPQLTQVLKYVGFQVRFDNMALKGGLKKFGSKFILMQAIWMKI